MIVSMTFLLSRILCRLPDSTPSATSLHLGADFLAVRFPAPPGENQPSSWRGVDFRRTPAPAGGRPPSFGSGKRVRRADVRARWAGGRRNPVLPTFLLIGGDTYSSSSPGRGSVRARSAPPRCFEPTLKVLQGRDAASSLLQTPLPPKPFQWEPLRFHQAPRGSRARCFAAPPLWRGEGTVSPFQPALGDREAHNVPAPTLSRGSGWPLDLKPSLRPFHRQTPPQAVYRKRPLFFFLPGVLGPTWGQLSPRTSKTRGT